MKRRISRRRWREEGCLGLLLTGGGAFRARLTQVALHRLRLSAAEEYLPRIAVVAVPADMVLIVLPYGNGPPPIWGGIDMRASDIMTLGKPPTHHRRETPWRARPRMRGTRRSPFLSQA